MEKTVVVQIRTRCGRVEQQQPFTARTWAAAARKAWAWVAQAFLGRSDRVSVERVAGCDREYWEF
jgi:hypothetical protein